MRGIVAALLLLLVTGCAGVEAADTTTETAEAPACTAVVAKPMDVRKLISQADKRLGDCVRVRGLVDSQYLYADRDAIYQQPRNASGLSSNGGALGLQRSGGQDWENAGLVETELVGTLNDCGRIQDELLRNMRETGVFILLGGFCHYSSSLFLSVDEEHVLGPLNWERQLQRRAARDYGNLTPARGSLREAARKVAMDFLAALRGGDRESVTMRNRRMFTQDDVASETLAYVFDDPGSPFANLRATGQTSQMEIFAYREPLWHTTPEEESSEQLAIVCFCRTADCRKSWPINSGDATNTPSRPYACIFVTLEEQDVSIDFPRSTFGLLEPAALR